MVLGRLGQGSPSTPYTVTIDTSGPSAPAISSVTPDTGASSTDRVTSTSDPNLLGRAEANSTVSVYQNGQIVGTCAGDSKGTWQYPSSSLADGAYKFTTIATDLAGINRPASAPFKMTVDTHRPDSPRISGVTAASGALPPQIQGTAPANALVAISLYGKPIGSTTSDASGSWTFGFALLSSTVCTISATASDSAGNVSAAAAFKLNLGSIDLTASSPQLLNPIGIAVDGVLTSSSIPILFGTAQAGWTVTIVDSDHTILGKVVVDANGQWSFTSPSLAKGKHGLSVFVTDLLGNSGLLSNPLLLQV